MLDGNCSNNGYIQIWDNGDPNRDFATWGAPADSRLHVRIAQPGEKIHMGFHMLQDYDDVYYRVKDPAGNVVFGPILIDTDSDEEGIIDACSEALAGPRSIVGSAGYNDTSFTTASAGDYYIEFAINQNPTNRQKRIFEWFDISVSITGSIQPGRLWSQAWDFTTNGGSNSFQAKLFAYSDDSVVTRFDFNGIQPYGFVVSCNSLGATDQGNFQNRRQSEFRQTIINNGGKPGVPEYPLFLNDPDKNEFPTGKVGELSGISVDPCSNNTYCIDVTTPKPGDVEINMTFPSGSPVTINSSVGAGTTCIPWDGRDGDGNLVQDGTQIDIEAGLLTGLTHLPLTDVEDHPNGYKVELVRPKTTPSGDSLLPPKIYWDDAKINTGTALDGKTNLAGCDPQATGGCHRWTGRGNNNSNPEVINTWWYANQEKKSILFEIDSSEWKVYADVNLNRITKNGGGSVCEVKDTITMQIRYNNNEINASSVDWNLVTNKPSAFKPIDTIFSSSGNQTFIDLRYKTANNQKYNNLNIGLEVTASGVDYPNCEATSSEQCPIAVLPVRIQGFQARAQERTARLRWHSLREPNMAGYHVLRSRTGQDFSEVGFLRSKGKGSTYELRDPHLQDGRYYYKLKGENLNGAQEQVAGLREIVIQSKALKISYQASQRKIRVAGPSSSGAGEFRVRIMDAAGRTLRRCGRGCSSVDVSGLAQGVYLIRAVDEAGRSATRRIMIR